MLFTIYFYIFMFTKISHRMKKIINRKHELNLLQKLYDRDSFAMATIYGLKNIDKPPSLITSRKSSTAEKYHLLL